MESFKIPRTKRPATVPESHGGGAQTRMPNLNPQIFPFNIKATEKDLKISIKYSDHVRGDDETELGETKTLLDDINPKKYIAIRNNNNPYESIEFFFQNRAAFKMVELDHHFGLVPSQGNSFLVADICSGPGGFSEYILTKLKWKAKVFGFTLIGKDDFKVGNFNPSSTTESFHAFYGDRKDGDITSLENLKSLEARIGEKIDLVTADGGFEISDYNKQELFSRKMLLGEFLTPLMLLKEGGNFACKLFSTYTDFSYDLLYLANCLYDEVFFTKPISSRVANSERFIVCKGFRGISEELLEELQGLLTFEGEIPEGSTQAAEVPDSFLDHSSESWKEFKSRLDEINHKVTRTQIYHLKQIINVSKKRYDKDEVQANVEIQNEIAKKISARVKIHSSADEESPAGYLYYSPLYGQKFSKKEEAIKQLEGQPKESLFLVKTGFGKRPRSVNSYYIQAGKVTKPFGELKEGTLGAMPFDTIVELEINNEGLLCPKHIVYSYLPPGYGDHDYKLLAKNTELF